MEPSVTRTIDDLARAGFAEHFGMSGDGLRSFTSGRRYRAGEVVIREFHRFEGVSDPDDMCIVYAIEAQGGARGTLVDAF
ncbi:MAG TPA: phosphoribosylpyrophosphate synthetase, partial [Planctomycetota bacterium]|nr:phosphoribosylpyrophosphate synthetase [Planctomycetota bacterium]